MGKWTLRSIAGTFTDHNTPQLYGTNFVVTYKLHYKPSKVGKFVETPMLDWDETIMMNEHHKSQTWIFHTNMYSHNPTSKTLEIWPKRYVEAYNAANGKPFSGKGYSKLFDDKGAPVKKKALSGAANNKAKADAVRGYLKKNGGLLEIQIHDIPSINKPSGDDHKERLLMFNCGVVGDGNRVKAEQYLNVDGSKPMSDWNRRFQLAWGTGLKITGLSKVVPPAGVSNKRDAVFFPGESW